MYEREYQGYGGYEDSYEDEPYEAEQGRGEARRPSRRRKRRRTSRWGNLLLLAVLILGMLLGWVVRDRLEAGKPEPSQTEVGEDLAEQLAALAKEEPKAAPLARSPEDYPAELLELALRNRETLDFVLGWPENRDSEPAASVEEARLGTVPLLLQWDPRWGYAEYGGGPMALNGCGPTALAMVLCALTGKGDVTPYTVAAAAQHAGYFVEGTGTSWELMSQGCRQFGLAAQELPLVEGRIISALEAGQPVICSVRAGDFTTSGHFIVLAGVEDGKFRVNDPNSRANSARLWDYDTLAPQISNLWAYTLG